MCDCMQSGKNCIGMAHSEQAVNIPACQYSCVSSPADFRCNFQCGLLGNSACACNCVCVWLRSSCANMFACASTHASLACMQRCFVLVCAHKLAAYHAVFLGFKQAVIVCASMCSDSVISASCTVSGVFFSVRGHLECNVRTCTSTCSSIVSVCLNIIIICFLVNVCLNIFTRAHARTWTYAL
jgi:hypothetical protein